jgi:hypothetical protein
MLCRYGRAWLTAAPGVSRMSDCGERAILIITGEVEGTSTHVARRRTELRCKLPLGHVGAHHDPEHAGEHWDAAAGQVTTLLRHEPNA